MHNAFIIITEVQLAGNHFSNIPFVVKTVLDINLQSSNLLLIHTDGIISLIQFCSQNQQMRK